MTDLELCEPHVLAFFLLTIFQYLTHVLAIFLLTIFWYLIPYIYHKRLSVRLLVVMCIGIKHSNCSGFDIVFQQMPVVL